MPAFCCVPGCSSDGTFHKGLSFHEFPSDKSLQRAWIHAVRRDVGPYFQIVPGSTKVCSLHFREEDYKQPSAKTLARRKKRLEATEEGEAAAEPRVYRVLLPGAIPSVFPSFPEPPAKKARPPPRQRSQPGPPEPHAAPCEDDRFQSEVGECPGVAAASESYSAESALAARVADLQELVQRLEIEKKALEAHVFSAERIMESTELLQFYTGFQSKGLFMACFHFLEGSARTMRSWQGGRTNVDADRRGAKAGPPSKLSLLNQFFFTCVRFRRGYPLEDFADRFKVSMSTLSRIFTTWVNLMYVKFKELPMYPSRRKVDQNMPACFRTFYPSTRIIIDCTEFYIQRPSSLEIQSASFSAYKNHNTCKLLVGISPDGAFTFMSELYEGSVSDRDLVVASGILEKLERGDSVMADKGFDIEDLLIPIGARLNIPPFLDKRQQMLPSDVRSTKTIAAVRIHVERAIGRLKQYRLLDGVIDNSLFDLLGRTIFVAAMLCNFQPSLSA